MKNRKKNKNITINKISALVIGKIKSAKPELFAPDHLANQDAYEREKVAKEILGELSYFDSPSKFMDSMIKGRLYKNQIDILNAIINDANSNVTIIQPRQAGKTEAAAAACIWLMEIKGWGWNNINTSPYKIGVFAPTIDQAQILLDRIKAILKNNELIDWEKTTKRKIVCRNGSEINALSAHDSSNIVGRTCNIIILDEAQHISDYVVSEKINPMLAATNGRLVKLGTVVGYRNHFYRSWHYPEPGAKLVSHRWDKCGNLKRNGIKIAIVDGKKVKLPEAVMRLMPKSIKEELFKNNPELWSEGSMDPEDFRTQYLLEWVDGYGAFLTSIEFNKLVGTHDLQTQSSGTEILVAGIDFAGANTEKSDETAVTVVRIKKLSYYTKACVLEKIFGVTFRGNPHDQLTQIKALLHPQTGVFKVRFILADETGCGIFPVAELKSMGLPIEGLMMGASNEEAKRANVSMNNKTAIFAYAKQEISNDRFKYSNNKPHLNPDVNVDRSKGLDQWSNLGVKSTQTANKKIEHAPGGHDDIPFSDALAIYASKNPRVVGYNYPSIVLTAHFGRQW